MKKINLFVFLILTIGLFTNFALANSKQANFKVIAQGNSSEIEQPFIFTARSAETYKQLQIVVKNLPEASTIDFQKFAVVAGFAGTRSTGGFSVEIKNKLNKITVDVTTPGKGMMVTQMITSPFKIVIVPISENSSLQVYPSMAFNQKMETYKVSSGNFEFTGGFAGRHKAFTANGTINVWVCGNLATFAFDLKGIGTEKKRQLVEISSGIIIDGKISLARLDAGSFSDMPRPPFSVNGSLVESKLTLTFSPLPTNVADGYSGSGNLVAVKSK